MMHHKMATDWRRSPRASQSGFTLLEMMLVMTILAILFAVSFTTFTQQARQNLVRQAAVQVQADLEQLRSSAIRYNNSFRMRWANTNKAGYSVEAPDPSVAGAVITRDRLLPDGVEIDIPPTPLSPPPAPPPSPPPTTSLVSYTAPLAEVSAADRVFRVRIANATGINPLYIKVLGVTGRVAISATN